MAAAVTAALRARADLQQLAGAGNEGMMEDNHLNHVRFFGSMLASFEPGLFVDTIHWVYQTYRSHGFAPRYWEVALPLWQGALAAELPRAARAAIEPFYRWLVDNHAQLVALSEAGDSPLGVGGQHGRR